MDNELNNDLEHRDRVFAMQKDDLADLERRVHALARQEPTRMSRAQMQELYGEIQEYVEVARFYHGAFPVDFERSKIFEGLFELERKSAESLKSQQLRFAHAYEGLIGAVRDAKTHAQLRACFDTLSQLRQSAVGSEQDTLNKASCYLERRSNELLNTNMHKKCNGAASHQRPGYGSLIAFIAMSTALYSGLHVCMQRSSEQEVLTASSRTGQDQTVQTIGQPMNPPAPAQVPDLPEQHTYYAVRPQDTLSAIAKRYYGDGLVWVRLSKANNLADPDQLYVGQLLRMPERGLISHINLHRLRLMETPDEQVADAYARCFYGLEKGETLEDAVVQVGGSRSALDQVIDYNRLIDDGFLDHYRLRHPGQRIRFPPSVVKHKELLICP